MLTFDDSKVSHYSVVRPLLKRYGFGATFFITEGFSFRMNKQDYMTWEQIAELHKDGFEIGNHTRDLLSVSTRTLPQLRERIAQNDERVRRPRQILEVRAERVVVSVDPLDIRRAGDPSPFHESTLPNQSPVTKLNTEY